MKAKTTDLNADELIQALTDVRDHVRGHRKITMRTTKLPLPKTMEAIHPREVRKIRETLSVSQCETSNQRDLHEEPGHPRRRNHG